MPKRLPLVAVVSHVPLLSESLLAAFEGIAEVRPYPAGQEDLEAFLRSLSPDAVVVDRDLDADTAAEFAREADVPLVHVSLRTGGGRVLADGGWDEWVGLVSPETIRNVVVGALRRQEVR
jgi:hypothetical protein